MGESILFKHNIPTLNPFDRCISFLPDFNIAFSSLFCSEGSKYSSDVNAVRYKQWVCTQLVAGRFISLV